MLTQAEQFKLIAAFEEQKTYVVKVKHVALQLEELASNEIIPHGTAYAHLRVAHCLVADAIILSLMTLKEGDHAKINFIQFRRDDLVEEPSSKLEGLLFELDDVYVRLWNKIYKLTTEL